LETTTIDILLAIHGGEDVKKMQLPGGGEVGLYQPKHPTALGLK
jgi:hypothetical protein